MSKNLKINTLCDLNKSDIEKHFNKIIEIVDNPKYICKKCARVANSESYLCKSIPINSKNK